MQSVLRELVIISAAVGTALLIQHIFYQKRRNKKEKRRRHLTADFQETNLRPPFPKPIVDLLQSASLCHMGVQLDDGTTHLCLMSFTYIPDEQTIIMSTRRNTTKFRAIQNIDEVTLLIHNFSTYKITCETTEEVSAADNDYSNTHSITLYGNVIILSGEDAEDMRLKHLERHGNGFSQFIIGKDIAVLSVGVNSAKICNIKDEVTIWDASDVAR